MANNTQKIGWIGLGRMGVPMAERLLKAGHDVTVWNRTRAKAEPLAKSGGKIADKLSDLAGLDVVFSIVSTGKDLDEVYFGPNGVLASGGKAPKIVVDCSTISIEDSASIRDLGSRNGTLLNGRSLTGTAVLKSGDLVQIGPLTFAVAIHGAPAAAVTTAD